MNAYHLDSDLKVNFSGDKVLMELTLSNVKEGLKLILRNKKSSLEYRLDVKELAEVVQEMRNILSGDYRKTICSKNGEDVEKDLMFYNKGMVLTIRRVGEDLLVINVSESGEKSLSYVFNIKTEDFFVFVYSLSNLLNIMVMLTMMDFYDWYCKAV